MLVTVISVILVFGLLIFFHELGHFIFAKASKVSVNEFSVGMGPAIFKKQKGETLYSIRILPFGGYNMLEEDRSKEGCFENASFAKKLMIMLAGAGFNLILGYVLLSIITAMNGYVGTTVVAQFGENSKSSQYLELGDRITRLNGHRVRTSNDIMYELTRDVDGLIDVELIRNDEKITVPVEFEMEEVAEGVNAIRMDFLVLAKDATFLDYLTYPFNWSMSLVKQVWGSLIDLITGRVPVNQLSGPVGIVSVIGQASKMGIKPLLMLSAFISVNLGIFNLIPLPILDGGKILLYFIEKLRGKPFSEKTNTIINNVSAAIILFLVLYATTNDVLRLMKG